MSHLKHLVAVHLYDLLADSALTNSVFANSAVCQHNEL